MVLYLKSLKEADIIKKTIGHGLLLPVLKKHLAKAEAIFNKVGAVHWLKKVNALQQCYDKLNIKYV